MDRAAIFFIMFILPDFWHNGFALQIHKSFGLPNRFTGTAGTLSKCVKKVYILIARETIGGY